MAHFTLAFVLRNRVLIGKSGAPGGTRTPDLLVRSQTLYPTELRAHRMKFNTVKAFYSHFLWNSNFDFSFYSHDWRIEADSCSFSSPLCRTPRLPGSFRFAGQCEDV